MGGKTLVLLCLEEEKPHQLELLKEDFEDGYVYGRKSRKLRTSTPRYLQHQIIHIRSFMNEVSRSVLHHNVFVTARLAKALQLRIQER